MSSCQNWPDYGGTQFFSTHLGKDLSISQENHVDPNHEKLSIRCQCPLLKVSRSSFYYEKAAESEYNLNLMNEVDRASMKWLFMEVKQKHRYEESYIHSA